MCGIAGFTGAPDRKNLKRMTDSLHHRGPDDEGFFTQDGVNLGMRRLAIVDLATGKQPMRNEDKSIWVICNGEIYNHQRLRAELVKKGRKFYTDHSDIEVLTHLYEEHGDSFASHLNGMFAIALWDLKRKKLMLVRDRMGKKPLYYSLQNNQIAFASEIKALAALPGFSKELDPVALNHYFSHKHVSAPHTIYKNVRQLMPGCTLIFENGKIEESPYWKLSFDSPLKITEDEAAIQLFKLLDDSVWLRMQCDVPFGAYLSGGLDSSGVVALMGRHQSKPVKTFCLGYEDDFKNKQNDLESARSISKRLGTEHHEYVMKASEVQSLLPEILRSFDEPFSGTVSTYVLSLLIKKHVKVALTGDGADELFGSYLTHRLAFAIDSGNYAGLSGSDRLTAERIAHPETSVWRNRLNVFTQDEKKKLFADSSLAGFEDDIYKSLAASATAHDALNKVLEMDQKELLPNEILPFVDRLSMAHSIEARVPFLDYRVVEFAARLPGSMKISNGVTKSVLKKMFKNILPDDLIARKKEGFVLPVYDWMKTSLKDFVRETLSPQRVRKGGILSPFYVETLVDDFYNGASAGRNEAKIWNLVCFQVWQENCYF